MKSSWRSWKTWTVAALALLLAADVALCVFLLQASREAPDEIRAQRDRLALQERLLKSDIERGEKIRASLPQVGKDCQVGPGRFNWILIGRNGPGGDRRQVRSENFRILL
jgi:hypothetical protein